MEEVKRLLGEILKELQFHGKLLSSIVEGADAREHSARNMKKDVKTQIEKAAKALEGTPFSNILKTTAARFGGKDGQ